MILSVSTKLFYAGLGIKHGGKNYVVVDYASMDIVNAITMGRIGEYYIPGNEISSNRDTFDKMAAIAGGKALKIGIANAMEKSYSATNSFTAKLCRFTTGVTKELADLSWDHFYYSAEKARKGHELPSAPIKVGFQAHFEWFKANGYLT